MKTLIYTLILQILVFSLTAKAALLGNSIFIEPSVGYRNETINLTDLSQSLTQIKSSSPTFGLKLGFRSLLGIDLNFAGDYSSGTADITSSTQKEKFSHSSVAVQVGVNSFGIVKMYLGTTINNEYKIENSATQTESMLSGPSYQAGIVLKFIPVINIGLQYNLNQYNMIKSPLLTNGDKLDTYYSKVDAQDYSAYISIPL